MDLFSIRVRWHSVPGVHSYSPRPFRSVPSATGTGSLADVLGGDCFAGFASLRRPDQCIIAFPLNDHIHSNKSLLTLHNCLFLCIT